MTANTVSTYADTSSGLSVDRSSCRHAIAWMKGRNSSCVSMGEGAGGEGGRRGRGGEGGGVGGGEPGGNVEGGGGVGKGRGRLEGGEDWWRAQQRHNRRKKLCTSRTASTFRAP